MGIFLNQLYKYREVDSACFYNSRGPGKNTKKCSDLKFGKKEGPKTGNFWNLRLIGWIYACGRSRRTQTTCYDHSSDLWLLGGHLDRFTTIFGVWGNPISPYHMEKSAEGMEAPKTKFQSTSYPKMFPNVFLRINYLSQSHLFGCGTRCQWFTVPKCASADFSIWRPHCKSRAFQHFRVVLRRYPLASRAIERYDRKLQRNRK